ncbi:MAG: hypothetical protein ACXVEF_07255 [Polyangiales bacterium]
MSLILSAVAASSIACALPGPLERRHETDEDCLHDEDGNGLDDAVEESLARCMVPELRFDGRERARRPGEPRALFNVQKRSPTRARIQFVLLFAEDRGFPQGIICRGRTAHRGDTEQMVVEVAIDPATHEARALLVDTGWPDGLRENVTKSGARPVLFASASKHHLYFAPYEGPFTHPYGCPDLALGDGDVITPTPEHVPIFAIEPPHAPAPLTPDRTRWLNACLVARHPNDPLAWRPAVRLRQNRFLPSEGFAGEEIEGATFLGSPANEVTPIWRALAIEQPPWRKPRVVFDDPLPDPTPRPLRRDRRPEPTLPATQSPRVSRSRRNA